MVTVTCELCGNLVAGRCFSRRDYMKKSFCSIACVEAFEVRAGLPSGRVYETRPGWSHFPLVPVPSAQLAC